MKFRISPKKIKYISKIGLFLCVIALIVQFFPSQNKFKYQFEIGKPWSYELVTASFDFPIYKNDQQLSKERTEVLKDFVPYFVLDTTVVDAQLKKLFEDLKKNNGNVTHVQRYIAEKFKKIYSVGILSVEDYNKMLEENRKSISCILPNRVSHTLNLDEVYTPKTAYEEILKDEPGKLKNLNLNLYLAENMKYDHTMTDLSKSDMLKSLSLTSGMVQSGERIIDRGEIVTANSFLTLRSLKIEYEKRKGTLQQSTVVVIGETIMIFVLISLFFIYILLFRPRIFESFSHLLFLVILIVSIVALTSFTINYTSFSYYMVPFAMLPIIIRVFFDSRTALFAHIITMMILAFIVDNSFQFFLLQVTIGMVAVSSLKDMTQRSQLAQTALYIFLSYVVMFLAFELFSEGDLQRIHWQPLISFAVSSIFLLFAYVLIYLFEKIFNLISSITLVELTNINSDLLMRFSELAPGTFQHTLQVSNLATEAAKKISANTLLVRTGALYHDIGKMRHPEYYIENQFGGENPLSKLDLEVAAKMVIGHVSDGIEIAKKNHLPEQIINFIATHHGKTKTKYFYNSFINTFPDMKVNDAAFAYPGPLPNTKETAILMMADAVEARSRSLGVYTDESIDLMVESMIDTQITEGQFKDAPITFRDVETVKSVFKEKIKNIYHTRIAYPEANTTK